MRRSSRRRLSVYDFGEEDEVVESASKKLMRKFLSPRNPKPQKTPITKYTFLQSFAPECNVMEAKSKDVFCIDNDEKNDDGHCVDDLMASTSANNDELKHICQDKFEHGNLISESENLVDVISDDEEGLEVNSPSASRFHMAENKGDIQDQPSHHCSSDRNEIEKKTNCEVVCPDYVSYEDRVFTRSQLLFFTDHIKLVGLDECGSGGSSIFEWVTDDLIHIECQQSEKVRTFLVRLCFRRTDVMEGYNCGTPDVVKLEFAIAEAQWQEKMKMITSLATEYKARWNSMLDPEIASEEDDLMGKGSLFFLRRYFADSNKPFEDIVYPEGDPDAVSLSERDVELLQPGTFINDTIIDFYIKYLQNKIQPQKKHQFHFFNSFFFRKLIDLDKDQKTAFEGRAAFQRVRKWTQKVNIFEKGYIFIPVNFNLHWSLLVICHPGEVATFKDEEIEMAAKVPCILHMDSIKGSHRGLKNLVQSYLWQEWKERHKESSETVLQKFKNLRFMSLELPQQENAFDCGLFLLHYVELFLEEAPVNFSPFKMTKVSNFLGMDWFPPIEASHKRSTIQQLIRELLDDHALRIPCGNQLVTPKSPEVHPEKEYAAELLAMHCNQSKGYLWDSVFLTNRENDTEFLAPSSPNGTQNDKGIIALQKFFGQGAEASGCSKYYQPYDSPSKRFHPTMSPVQEEAETSRHSTHSVSDEDKLSDGVRPVECAVSRSPWDLITLIPASPEISMQMECEPKNSLSESSSCGSPDSPKTSSNENSAPCPSRYLTRPHDKQGRKLRSAMPTMLADEDCEIPILDEFIIKKLEERVSDASNSKNLNCLVEDSLEAADTLREGKENGDSFSSRPENLPLSCQAGGPSEDSDLLSGECIEVINEGLGNQACSSKRMPPYRGHRCTRRCTHS